MIVKREKTTLKSILIFSCALLVLSCKSTVEKDNPEEAKEEVGNTEYLSDGPVNEQLEAKRSKRLQGLMASHELFEPGEEAVYQGENLEAIEFPIGAFGGGHLILDGTGKLKHWKIFNNQNLAYIPHSFFAVRTKAEHGATMVKALQTSKVEGFPSVDALTFKGEYPIANISYLDKDLSVDVTLETFNPFIPMDLKNSAIPGAFFKFTASNPTDSAVEVSFLYSQQNAVGYRVHTPHTPVNSSVDFFKNDTEFINPNRVNGKTYKTYGRNSNTVKHSEKGTYVHLTKAMSKDSLGYGDMTFGIFGEKGDGNTSWGTSGQLYTDFLTTGSPGKATTTAASENEKTHNAALTKSFTLKPGEHKTVTFFLAWYFPNGESGSLTTSSWGRGQWGGQGTMYSNWWNNSLEVADYLQAHLEELTAKTHLYHDSFYKTNLPHWLKDRITAQTSILKTNTMFWDKNGYIGGWEGISPRGGACAGNCTHVWHYAQANARLFPEIGRKMREQSLDYMKDDGMIPYRHPNGHEAFDGQCGEILQVYREYLTSTNPNWLKQQYPKIKMATEFIISTWDADENGILEGAKHNTLDSQLGGNSAWHGSLYAAALKACAEMDRLCNNAKDAARYNAISKKAIRSHLETLWNGEYFIQIPDETPRADFLTGCATDQMLGQWWANQLHLGNLYPEETVKKTMDAVFKYNFKANFQGIRQYPREFAKPDEAGLLMITWPKGGRPKPHTSYADEVMSGFEYAAAATMIQSDNLTKGMTILKAVSDRYTGKLKVGYKGGWGNWGYSGNPFGDDECGKFYSRAMSIWSVLLASQGFQYNGPEQSIGFDPVWQPADHNSFFTTAEGWGNFSQKRTNNVQKNRLELAYGKLLLSRIGLVTDLDTKNNLRISLNGEEINASFKKEDRDIAIEFKTLELTAGDVLDIEIY
jgi:uncharacterized protein (DUF608 family)